MVGVVAGLAELAEPVAPPMPALLAGFSAPHHLALTCTGDTGGFRSCALCSLTTAQGSPAQQAEGWFSVLSCHRLTCTTDT